MITRLHSALMLVSILNIEEANKHKILHNTGNNAQRVGDTMFSIASISQYKEGKLYHQ